MVLPCEERSSGGELYFLCSTHSNLRIRANVFGYVNTSRKYKGWEVWRFVESNRGDGTFFISPWEHSQFYLSSFPGGRVNTTRNQHSWELWKLEKESNGTTDNTVTIRSLAHNRFLQLDEDGYLSTIESYCLSNKCWWNLESANLGKYYLHCMGRNKQLRCSKNTDKPPYSTDTFEVGAVWYMQKAPEGDSFTIRSDVNKGYLQLAPNCTQVTLSTESSLPTQQWYLRHHPNNGSVVITSVSGGMLACSVEGLISILQDDEDGSANAQESSATNWQLVPKMPDTTSGKQVAACAGISVGSLVLGIATPYLVLGLVHSLGFTAHGIPAGSFAAKEMSRVAKSYGGSIPPGCWFATLQSIGVLGLGSTRFTLAFVVGCVFGAVIFRLILVFIGLLEQQNNPCTSGIVASESMGGILSNLDSSVGRGAPRSTFARNEQDLNDENQLSFPAMNQDATEVHPAVPEVEVHRNNSTMDTSSMASSRFNDFSSISTSRSVADNRSARLVNGYHPQ
ncbi:unnamed protein product [Cylindrotheca closterium]|uniref:Uncharacterized protein n=1 Tax=Cylindrotheca closterium TaxID=2856 RepID=A0AAD2G8L8_9STRA|nr:unnamed protein product [Cylindrotheca closterium]